MAVSDGIHRPDADEKAGVDHIQIVELMSFAVDIEDRGLRVFAEPAGSRLVSHAGDGNFIFEICITWNQMVRMHAQVVEHGFQLVVELLFWHLVIRRVRQRNVPLLCPRLTRLSGSGRSSVESQKSTACRAISSSMPIGASAVSRGFSPLYISPTDLPTIWIFPIGKSNPSIPK